MTHTWFYTHTLEISKSNCVVTLLFVQTHEDINKEVINQFITIRIVCNDQLRHILASPWYNVDRRTYVLRESNS